MAPPQPELMEELTEEILLRLPPDNPKSLLRAALVCKLWRRLVCGAAFHRRFLEFHRRFFEFHRTAIPLLCVLYNYRWDKVRMLQMRMAYFVPATSFRPPRTAAGHDHGKFAWHAIDARHDRVLLCRSDPSIAGRDVLSVWDPITDKQNDLPALPFHITRYTSSKWNAAAVTCATAASPGGSCDHLDCHRGPFLVLYMEITHHSMYLCTYSSESVVWSNVTIYLLPTPNYFLSIYKPARGVLMRSAFYFLVHFKEEIVGYDMATREVSTVRLPDRFRHQKRSIVLMTDDDGGLGFVANFKDKLELWSRVADADDGDDEDFILTRIIDLRKVLPFTALFTNSTQVNGFADGGARRVLFISMLDSLYSIDINSSQVRKLNNFCGDKDVVPYISFCTPTSRIQN